VASEGRLRSIGRARGQPSASAALQRAIRQCVRAGGLPACCREGSSVIRM
jgi:hypothetical protein